MQNRLCRRILTAKSSLQRQLIPAEFLEPRYLLASDPIANDKALPNSLYCEPWPTDVPSLSSAPVTTSNPLVPTDLSFAPVLPLGALIYQATSNGQLSATGEVDSFTFVLASPQSFSFQVRTPNLQGQVIISEPSTGYFRTLQSTAPGQDLIGHTDGQLASGNYTIEVSDINGAIGDYSLLVFLNADIEDESLSTIQNIDSSGITYDASLSRRLAVVGTNSSIFSETFPTTTLDTSKWLVTSTATIDAIGLNEPSAPNSARLNGNPSGADLLESQNINLSGLSGVTFSYAYQRAGGGDSPETGDDLILDYRLASGVWMPLERQLGSGADMTQYETRTVTLPSDAYHSTFRFRFRNVGTAGTFDDWFVDDIKIESAASNIDSYGFEISTNQTFTIVYTPLSDETDSILELRDVSGQRIALGDIAENSSITISDVSISATEPLPASFTVSIANPSALYSLVVLIGATFDREPNSTLNTAQVLGPSQSALGQVGSTSGSAIQMTKSFEGISATGFIPPDPTAAVGPSQLVAAVNTDLAIYDKATGNQLFRQNMSGTTGFFGSVGATTSVFDPWVIYDDDSQRFFVVGIDVASSFSSFFYLAVSKTSTPTSGTDWYKYRIVGTHNPTSTLGSGAHFPDYEKMGVNDEAIFLSGNYFPISSGSGVYAGITAIAKAPLLTGGAASIVYQEFFSGFSVFPLNQYDSGSIQYFAEEVGSGSIRMHAVRNVLTSPQRSTLNLAVSAYNDPINVPQLGGGVAADSIDARIMTGVWRDGSAYFAHAITDPAEGTGEDVIRWYQVETNNWPVSGQLPTLVQSGNFDPGPGLHAWMPAIAVDANGNVGLGFSVGGPSIYYGAGFTGRLASDPLGQMNSAYVHYAVGQANYQALDGSGRNRWGDYTGLSVDPADGTTFWAYNSYAAPSNRWSTRVATFTLDPVAESDTYKFGAIAGDNIVIETSTPLDTSSFLSPVLDPILDLYDINGLLLATNDNGSLDGRNAVLSYAIESSGEYFVRVRSASTSAGTYALKLAGVTSFPPPLTVIDTNPDNNQVVRIFPTLYRVEFSNAVDLRTVQATDLLINGLEATSFSVVGASTIDFAVPTVANVGNGNYTISIAAQSIFDLSGQPLFENFVNNFEFDNTGPRILATSWNGLTLDTSRKVSGDSLTTFTATFSEDLYVLSSARRGPFTPGTDDIRVTDAVTGTTFLPNSVTYDPQTDTVSATFSSPIRPGAYVMRLVSGGGAFEDLYGNALDGEFNATSTDGTPTGNGTAGGDYLATFYVDEPAVTANDFERLQPFGSLISTSSNNDLTIYSAADIDELRFEAAVGEKISLTVERTSGSSDFSVVVPGLIPTTSNAGASTITVNSFAVPATGTYTLNLSASGSSKYRINISKNAVLEGLQDSSTPVSLDSSALTIGDNATRLAATGKSHVSTTVLPTFARRNNINEFIDISPTGTNTGIALNLAEDASTTVTTTIGNWLLPAGPVSIANNGGILAGTGTNLSSSNSSLPTSNIASALLPYWDDFDDTTGDVYWDELEIGGINTLIVQWESLSHFFSSASTGTFQLQLFETGPVLARYVYKDVDFGSTSYNNGRSATIGYQRNSSNAVQVSLNTSSVFNGDVIEFIDPRQPDIDDYTLNLSSYVGNSIDVAFTLLNNPSHQRFVIALLDDVGQTLAVADNTIAGASLKDIHLAIDSFTVPATLSNVFTIRVIGAENSDYSIIVTANASFELEANDTISSPLVETLEKDDTALGWTSNRREIVVLAEPDLFPNGTLLENAFSGVRLSAGSSGGVYSTLSNGTYGAATGSNVMSAVSSFVFGFDEAVRIFRATFAGPVSEISVAVGYFSNAIGRLRAYNANNNLVAEVSTTQLNAAGQWQNLSIKRPEGDISYITIGGSSGFVLVDNLQARAYPPEDHYKVSLLAGEVIVLNTALPNAGSSTPANNLDPRLTVYGELGEVLASDDNSLDGRNARLQFTAPVSGEYFIKVDAASGAGEYLVHRSTPPTVESVRINHGSNIRSMLTSVEVQFDRIVDHSLIDPSAFRLTNIDTATDVTSLLIHQMDDSSGKTRVELRFASGPSVTTRLGADLLGNSLSDGNYRLTVLGNRVLDGTTGGTMATDYVFGGQQASEANNDNFYRLFGDSNANGFVNVVDRVDFAQAFLQALGYRPDLDANGDGVINVLDRVAFSVNFLRSRA